ncbi:MAG: prolyl oligopeptidase family serine peptidase [Lachnospiraceae bacterium]|nr:prolyl oligopeptidase family serine peptidase [Lachnospiraceae bacterium]
MLNYQNRQGNPATFETITEVCAHAPEAVDGLSGNNRIRQIANPAFQDFPEDILYVYRSPNLYGGETAARNNTVFVVFSDKRYADKETALDGLKKLGLVELINEQIGSILLVMPKADTGYGESDLQACYTMVDALFSQKIRLEIDGEPARPAESEYCGGYGKTYFFGFGQGATFMNNFIAGSRDELIGRVAGYFTFGGEMAEDVLVNDYVPAYLVNPCSTAVRQFRQANGCNAYACSEGVERFYNQQQPLRQVRVSYDTEGDAGAWMVRAYQEMFRFLQRTANLPTPYPEPVVTNPYQGYVRAPKISRFALSERNPVINDRTVIGDLQLLFVHDSETFADIKITADVANEKYKTFIVDENDYLDAWYEVLPQSVLNNTAPEHSVPLLLANHGGGDDLLMFLDETGILLTAGQQQFAIVAGMHSGLTFVGGDLVGEMLSRLVQYMLKKYPALDPERVYVTGYSMGGAASYACLATHPELFAAAVPMAMPLFWVSKDMEENSQNLTMPMLLCSSTYDFAAWDTKANHLNDGAQLLFRTYQGYNGMAVPEQFDFVKYPFVGQPTDSMKITTVNGEWRNFEWKMNGTKGYPMMGLNVTEYLVHSLWPGYGDIAWDFFRHYRRDAKTGETIYCE